MGVIYGQQNPLCNGQIQIRYPTIKDQDILLTRTFLNNNTALDNFLRAIVVDKAIDLDNMLVGDRNMLIMVARIMTHGSEYNITVKCPNCQHNAKTSYDLNSIGTKRVDLKLLKQTGGLFQIQLPKSGKKIKVKLLTAMDSKLITQHMTAMQKLKTKVSSSGGGKIQLNNLQRTNNQDNILQMQFMQRIVQVDGKTDRQEIEKFVKQQFLSLDKKVVTRFIDVVQPDIQTQFNYTCSNCGKQSIITLPITEQLFWPTN